MEYVSFYSENYHNVSALDTRYLLSQFKRRNLCKFSISLFYIPNDWVDITSKTFISVDISEEQERLSAEKDFVSRSFILSNLLFSSLALIGMKVIFLLDRHDLCGTIFCEETAYFSGSSRGKRSRTKPCGTRKQTRRLLHFISMIPNEKSRSPRWSRSTALAQSEWKLL